VFFSLLLFLLVVCVKILHILRKFSVCTLLVIIYDLKNELLDQSIDKSINKIVQYLFKKFITSLEINILIFIIVVIILHGMLAMVSIDLILLETMLLRLLLTKSNKINVI